MTSEAKAQRFKCDNCGAELTWDAAARKLKCAHCGAVRDVPSAGQRVVEHDLFSGLAQLPRGLGTEVKVHRCQECGANVSFPTGVTATRCTFCGGSRVLDQAENA